MSESTALRLSQMRLYSGINTSYTAATSVEIALFSIAPADTGVGGTELTGGGYSRPSVGNNATTWEIIGTTLKNKITIGFVAPAGAWADAVAWWAIDPRDSSRMFGGALRDAPISFAIGVVPSFDVGALTHTKLT